MSSEISQLQEEFDKDPDNIPKMLSFAMALHQARRSHEALVILFAHLSKDVDVENGEVKGLYLQILTGLGQGSALANEYRRKLYDLYD